MAENKSKMRWFPTSYWDDEWVLSLDYKENLLFLFLVTNPLTKISGVYKITIKHICFYTPLTKEEVETALEKFARDGKAFYKFGYIIIPRWPRHQKYKVPAAGSDLSKADNNFKAILNDINELPHEIIDYIYEVGYCFEPLFLNYTPLSKGVKTPLQGSEDPSPIINIKSKSNIKEKLNSNSDSNPDTDSNANHATSVLECDDTIPAELASYFYEQRKLIKTDLKYNRHELYNATESMKELLKERDVGEIKSVIRESTSDKWFSRIRGCGALQIEYDNILKGIK